MVGEQKKVKKLDKLYRQYFNLTWVQQKNFPVVAENELHSLGYWFAGNDSAHGQLRKFQFVSWAHHSFLSLISLFPSHPARRDGRTSA